jgi:hypothetical protein
MSHQVMTIALGLRALGVTDADKAPLEVWRKLHFLRKPKASLIKKLNQALRDIEAHTGL